MSSVRIWVAGPRAWENPDPIDKVIRSLAGTYGIGRLIIITGAATGVDSLAEDIATQIGVHTIHVKACWPVGRKAGPMRNNFIARELTPKALVAFHYYPLDQVNHRGTQSGINAAKRHGIPVKLVRAKPEVALPSSVSDLAPGSGTKESRRAAKLAARKARKRQEAS